MGTFHLDPVDTMILFADLQAGIVERGSTNEIEHLRRAVGALAKLAALFELPVIVTGAPSPDGPKVIPEITNALGELPLHVRTTTDAFTHTPTKEAILGCARKTLLIAGVATEIVVQHSALSGAAAGLAVQVVVDACSGLSERTEEAAFRRMARAGVTSTSVASIAGQLAADFSQPKGAQALGILYEMASS